jgi:hypothetical protein
LLNGIPGRWIECKNGLRQGDLLSPYLYLIITRLLRQVVTHEDGGSRVLHTLFDDYPFPVVQYVDDTLILVRATQSLVSLLKDALDTFSVATWLTINYHKSMFAR